MRHLYEFRFTSRCPVDNRQDNYHCKLSSDKMILAEDILAFCDRVEMEKNYQEDLAGMMKEIFSAEVHLIGWHKGVKITSTV